MRLPVVFLTASACASAAVLSFGPAAHAETPNYASLSKSLYGDETCSTVLMSVDLGPNATPGTSLVSKGVRPKNTSCVLLQSFVRLPGATIASREVVAQQGADVLSPASFASSKLPAIQLARGEHAGTVRIASSSSSVDVLKTEEGKWRIAYGGEMYDLDWEPVEIKTNPVTQAPYALGANGKLWTPSFAASYPSWNGAAPVIRAIDSKGNLLVSSLAYDRLYDLWINKTYVGRYSDVDRDASIAFSDERAASAFYPGYVMTFADAIGFDASDRLVIYRQEGRVFTRTAYTLK